MRTIDTQMQTLVHTTRAQYANTCTTRVHTTCTSISEQQNTLHHSTTQHSTAQHNKATQTNTCRNHRKKTVKTKKIEHITTQYKTSQRSTRPQNDTKKHRTSEQKKNASHRIASHTTTHTLKYNKHIVVTTRGHQVLIPNTKKTQKF